MIILAIIIVVFALASLVIAIVGGISKASDLTYYLCRPFIFFSLSMKWGFLGWLILFAGAGWAINYIISHCMS